MEDNPTNLEPMVQSREVITDGEPMVPAIQALAILVCTEQNPIKNSRNGNTSDVPNYGIGEISKHLVFGHSSSVGLHRCLCFRVLHKATDD